MKQVKFNYINNYNYCLKRTAPDVFFLNFIKVCFANSVIFFILFIPILIYKISLRHRIVLPISYMQFKDVDCANTADLQL